MKPTDPPPDRRTTEPLRGAHPGDVAVKVKRPQYRGFAHRGRGQLEASVELEEPRGPFALARRLLVGNPIRTEHEHRERLSKKKALAVFSSDALSSVAYTPQETLLILLTAGMAAITWSLPISIAVVCLLAIVVSSYRQTIYAYPTGGGSYIVARENLGETAGLVAAAALVVGYILTVSVSIASAIDQLVSAVPDLLPARVALNVVAILLVTLANLRGIRESGNIFALPTYIFLALMFGMIGTALFKLSSGTLEVAPPEHLPEALEPLTLLLLLRAFAVGSAVMTGTEAISNGIPAFQAPESRNAARTITAMAVILATMFLGLSVVIVWSQVIPSHGETVISLLARAAYGDGVLYYAFQASAVLILILAANTAYADFPRLSSLGARDGYAPRQLAFRGERLAFTYGILLLGVLSAILNVLFGGSTGAILPLYAVCVFIAFTCSQAGMVVHWRRIGGAGWWMKAALNGLGALVTGLVAAIAALTTFMNPNLPIVPGFPIGWGSWMIVIIIPILVLFFRLIHAHYVAADRARELPPRAHVRGEPRNAVVVPIARVDRPAVEALRFARSLTREVTAVHVSADGERTSEIRAVWDEWGEGVPLTIIQSPYRSLTQPLLQYLSELRRHQELDYVTVVVPEYVPEHWWEHLLHGQSAQVLKWHLLFRPGFVVTSVPCHDGGTEPGDAAEGEPAATA